MVERFKGMDVKRTIPVLLFLLALITQACRAADIGSVGADTASANVPEYTFDRFYDEMWGHRGYTETDREVCRELPKVLNTLNAGPLICLVRFPKDSPFKNLEWTELSVEKALDLERLRLGRSPSYNPNCRAPTRKAVLDQKLTDSIRSSEVIYQSTMVDIDNDGKQNVLLKRIWKERHCDKEKEFGHPIGVHLMHECRDEQDQMFGVAALLTSQDAFEYKGKHYLFSWNGIRPEMRGYINVNEIVSSPFGSGTDYANRQICRINYQKRTAR